MKSPWIDQKSARASASSVVLIGWDSSSSPCSSPLKSSLLKVWSRLRVGFGNSQPLPDNFGVPSATGNIKSSPLCGVNTSFALRVFEDGFLQFSHILNVCDHNVSFPNSLRDQDAYPRNIPNKKLSYQIGGALIDLALKSDDVQTLLQKEQPGL